MPAAASKLVRCIARCLGVMVLASACLPAWADVWGYVDAKGVTHFATERLDDRYQLFFKTGDSFSAGLDGGVGVAMPPQAGLPGSIGLQAPPALPERKATLPAQDGGRSQARLLAYFDVSPGYKAVKHLLKESSQKHGIDYECGVSQGCHLTDATHAADRRALRREGRQKYAAGAKTHRS